MMPIKHQAPSGAAYSRGRRELCRSYGASYYTSRGSTNMSRLTALNGGHAEPDCAQSVASVRFLSLPLASWWGGRSARMEDGRWRRNIEHPKRVVENTPIGLNH